MLPHVAEPDKSIGNECVQQFPRVFPACEDTRAMAAENSLEFKERSSSPYPDSGSLGEISDSFITLEESMTPKSSPSVRLARPDKHVDRHQGVHEGGC